MRPSNAADPAAHGPVIQSAESLRKWGYLGSIPSGATTAGARLPDYLLMAAGKTARRWTTHPPAVIRSARPGDVSLSFSSHERSVRVGPAPSATGSRKDGPVPAGNPVPHNCSTILVSGGSCARPATLAQGEPGPVGLKPQRLILAAVTARRDGPPVRLLRRLYGAPGRRPGLFNPAGDRSNRPRSTSQEWHIISSFCPEGGEQVAEVRPEPETKPKPMGLSRRTPGTIPGHLIPWFTSGFT